MVPPGLSLLYGTVIPSPGFGVQSSGSGVYCAMGFGLRIVGPREDALVCEWLPASLPNNTAEYHPFTKSQFASRN